jgi:hypothetical protein
LNEEEKQKYYESSLLISKQAAWTRNGLQINEQQQQVHSQENCSNQNSEEDEEQEKESFEKQLKLNEKKEVEEKEVVWDFGSLEGFENVAKKKKEVDIHSKNPKKKEERRARSRKMRQYYSELETSGKRATYDVPSSEEYKKQTERSQQQDISWKEVDFIFRNCSAIVGLHPDQATEAIVDFALFHNKPFAVIPCCVYAKEFPKRKLADGTLVSTYELLIKYLLCKHKEIKTFKLDEMNGPNLILYYIPTS